MNDKDKTVESTISLSLKPKSKPANTPITKDPAATQETISEEAKSANSDVAKKPAYVVSSLSSTKDEDTENKRTTSKTEKKPLPTYLKSKSKGKRALLSWAPFFLGLLVVLVIFWVVFASAGYMANIGNQYYVESTISLPSEIETEQEAMVLSSCVIDYTKEANPKEMIDLVHDKYNYLKGENDLVQNLVSSGCDLTVNPPIIKIGSLTQAIFR